MKTTMAVIATIVSLFFCIVPAYAHRDNNPATNLVKMPGVTVTDNGYLQAGREGIKAILNPDRTADPQTGWTGAFHSNNRTGPADYVTLTITFPSPQTFNRIAWNSGSIAGSTWWGLEQAWWADADGNTIVRQYSSKDNVSSLHDPIGPIPVGGQHEMAMFAPVTATSLTLTFTPISRAGGWYWSVRDIHVWLDDSDWDQQSGDTLAATDTLGRRLPDYIDCGDPKQGKYVAIMYEPWFLDDQGTPVYDITYILSQPDPKPWGCVGCFHWWGQPELGYYSYAYYDTYVMRKGVQMLSDAGVDVLFVDVTNSYTYDLQCERLFNVLHDMSIYGLKVPKVTFWANTANVATISHLYDHYYSQDFYSDLWFYWDGKPLIYSSKDGITDQEILDFFTWRKPVNWAVNRDEWSGGMELYPQRYGWHVNSSTPEEMSVSVAQKETNMTDPTARGRSYHNGSQPPSGQTDYSGRNFQEQWDRALSVLETANPAIVFLTSWNEWLVQRFINDQGQTSFVDQYNEEFSRDIEPMLGEHGDNYYYQMVGNIRKFKGVTKPSSAGTSRVIAIDGSFSDWDGVYPVFADTPGDARQENWPAWGQSYYVNNTGRNDIIRSKVTYDSSYVYFYVETASSLTSYTDPSWMRLFINSDCSNATGWFGYDYLVGDPSYGSTDAALGMYSGGGTNWSWSHTDDVSYKASGNRMEIAIPRSDIGLSSDQTCPALEFHWADNMQNVSLSQFSVSGDSAPDRLFNYRYGAWPNWHFLPSGDTEGWAVFNHIDSIYSLDSNRGGRINNYDPYLVSPSGLDFGRADNNQRIEFKMKLDGGGVTDGQIYWITDVDNVWNETKHVNFTAYGYNTWRTYSVPVPDSNRASGRITQFRIDPGSGASPIGWYVNFDWIQVTSGDPVWEFLPSGDIEGWTTVNNMTSPASSGGIWSAAITGEDPYVVGWDDLRYPAVVTNRIQMRMKISGGGSGAGNIFWTTTDDSNFNSAKSMQFSVTGDNTWQVYDIPVGIRANWHGTIRQLRVNPVSGIAFVNQTVQMDYVNMLSGEDIDTVRPTGSISINSGAAYTDSTSVMLTLSAVDAESGVAQMRLISDGYSQSIWEPYATSKSWMLAPGCGAKTVYVQFEDAAGNISWWYNDSIILRANVAELNLDCGNVNLSDFALFSNNWRQTGCTLPDYCNGSDINQDGVVDLTDLAIFSQNWLWSQ